MAFIEFKNIVKVFAGVTALNDVSLSIERGETHALMGENGAGKSTLGKSLAGVHRPTSGRIFIDGKPAEINSPADAARYGIGMVHQELAFVPELSIAENLSLGKAPRKFGFFLSRREMVRRAKDLLGHIGVTLDVTAPMKQLSTAEEQLVQIASAIGTGANVLIFDEPTSSLSERESRQLFALMADLKKRGVTQIYVSHRMPEVFALCDRISVLRDGRYVGTLDRAEATQDKVVQMMIGRPVSDYLPDHLAAARGNVVLEVKNLRSPSKFENVNLSIRAGEIVGLAGLVGAGRSEIARAIFGLDPMASGSVKVDGNPVKLGSIRSALRAGIGMVPEDRKRQGLVLMMSGRYNFSLASLSKFSAMGFLKHAEERIETEKYFDQLKVKTSSIAAAVAGLSGGNQQKVVIAKWLARGGKLLIVDEPTRGVDVGAKAAIHKLLDELAKSGVAILLISSELPEVIALSSRILVMREGQLAGEIPHGQATQENVLRLMAGVESAPAA
jgi:ABC-type sugar transport system ATPase subunit